MADSVDKQEFEAPNIGAEVEAMKKVADALKELDRDAVTRVIAWIADAYRIQHQQPRSVTSNTPASAFAQPASPPAGHEQMFTDANDLYHATSPSSDVERALVVGYWFQVCQGQEDFDSQSVNGELKQLGYPVGNITRAFEGLQKRKPVLASQTRKSGTSRQARKKYKLTRQGIAAVEGMIRGQGLTEE